MIRRRMTSPGATFKMYRSEQSLSGSQENIPSSPGEQSLKQPLQSSSSERAFHVKSETFAGALMSLA